MRITSASAWGVSELTVGGSPVLFVLLVASSGLDSGDFIPSLMDAGIGQVSCIEFFLRLLPLLLKVSLEHVQSQSLFFFLRLGSSGEGS